MRKRSRPFVKQAYAAMTLMLSVMASAGCGSGVEQDKPLNQTEMTDKAGAEDNRTESGSKKLLSGGESGDTEKAWQQEPGRTEAGGEDRETSEAESVSGESGTDNTGAEEPDGSHESEGDTAGLDMPGGVPDLPGTGAEPKDFVPEGWELLDCVALDFNGDGMEDHVGVLEPAMEDMGDYGTYQEGPRILFAIAGDGAGGYRLDFQDINLIRTREEGGVFGDPYLPLTAEGNSFTTHAFGGSAWKWSEDFTYTFRDGTWYLAMSESTDGYGSYITSYEKDDWEHGVGIRKKRSDEFSWMEDEWDSQELWEDPIYDIEYELTLDGQPTLYQAGMRWWLAPDRVTDWSVESVEFAAGVALSEDKVKRPEEAYLNNYCDEDCVLYGFTDEDSGCHYLARYRLQDRTLSVVAQETSPIESMKIYKGKIYYTTEIEENITYRAVQDGQTQLVEEEDTVGIRLNRMNLDGSGKESVFEYRYPGADREIMDKQPPYLSLIYEIGGDEIVAEVYVGSEPRPVYRMGTDGSGARLIGQIPSDA